MAARRQLVAARGAVTPGGPESDGSEARAPVEETFYDASRAPDAEVWLAMGEDAQQAEVAVYHRTEPHPPAADPVLHAVAHALVETQIARRDPEATVEAAARLVAAGASRHDVIHALGGLVMGQLLAGGFEEAPYLDALAQLTPETLALAAQRGLELTRQAPPRRLGGPHRRTRKGRRKRPQ
ncbi:MAG: hypothetical protein R3B72_33110 [Polyangiaceae bacterium]